MQHQEDSFSFSSPLQVVVHHRKVKATATCPIHSQEQHEMNTCMLPTFLFTYFITYITSRSHGQEVLLLPLGWVVLYQLHTHSPTQCTQSLIETLSPGDYRLYQLDN